MSTTTYQRRKNAGKYRLRGPVRCRCGENLKDQSAYMSIISRSTIAGRLHAPAFYHFCIPCGVQIQRQETNRKGTAS